MYDGEGRVADLILQPNFSSLSKLGWARNPKEKSQSGIFQSEIFFKWERLKTRSSEVLLGPLLSLAR